MRVENLKWAWKSIGKQKAFTWLLLTSIKNWYKTQIQKLRLLHCSKWWRLNLIETWIRKLMLPCSWLFLRYYWEFRSFKRMKSELCTHDARECVLQIGGKVSYLIIYFSTWKNSINATSKYQVKSKRKNIK